ncbi:MAG: peptidyl-prolyl cis-trans isomerase [Kiritimatiellales bacterium]
MKIKVNDEVIPEEYIRQEIQRYRQQHLGTEEKEAFDAVSRQMIEWALIRQAATAHGAEVTPEEIEEGYEELCRSHGGQEQFFRRFGLTEADTAQVKNDVERNRRLTKFLDELSGDVPPPADDAVSAYYDDHKTEFMHPEKIHAAHIVKHPQGDAAIPAAAAALRAARQRILAGEDFMAVAEACSECSDTSPDLGEFEPGQMVPDFDLVVFSMNPGEISPVFRTQFGLHVATVLSRTEARPMELTECRGRIIDQLLHDAKNDAIGNWVDAEKTRAAIEIDAE